MKRFFKRALTLVLVVCTILPLASCSLFREKSDNETFVMTTAENTACRIIYPSGNEASTWRKIANEFARALRRITGVTAEVSGDDEAESDNELLLGKTNRALSVTANNALSGNSSFSFTAENGKFAICASDVNTMEMAIHYFEIQYSGTLGGTLDGAALSFPGTLAFSRTVTAAKSEPADLLSGTTLPNFNINEVYTVAANGTCKNLTASAVQADMLYVALTDGNGNTQIIRKLLSSGELSATGEPLALGEAVSMCYNPVLDLLVVAHGGKESKQISLVNPETLSLFRTITISEGVDAIAYDAKTLCFVAKSAGENRFVFLNNAFTLLEEDALDGVSPSALSTGEVTFCDMTADSDFLYLLYGATSAENTTKTIAVILERGGAKRYVTDLSACSGTPLTIAHSGRIFYVTNADGKTAGTVNRINLTTLTTENEPCSLFNDRNTAQVDTSFVTTQKLFDIYPFIKSDYSRNNVLQGACTDGTCGYFFMEYQGGKDANGNSNYSNSETHDTIIVKVDLSTYEMVACSAPLKLGHSNDGCYNPRIHQLIVCYNGNNSSLIKLIDPDTLLETGSYTLPVKVFSIAYNAYTGQYIVGLSGGRDFAILDADFNVVVPRLSTDGPEEIYAYTLGTNLLTQGIDCDSQYVYFVLSGKGDTDWVDYLLAFDYEGKHQFTKILPGLTLEIENIFHIGTNIYVSCNGGNEPCYRVSIS